MAKNTVWRGAFWLSVGAFVSKLLGAVYRIFLPRVLGDYGVGLFQIAYPLYAILLAISVNGIPTALAKQTAEKLSRGDMAGADSLASWAQLTLGLTGMGFAVLMELTSSWIANVLFREPAAVWAVRALAPAIAFVALEASFRGYFLGWQDMRPTAISQMLEQVSRVMVMFPLAYRFLPLGIDKAAAGATLGAPIGALVGMLFLGVRRFRVGRWSLGRRFPVRDLGRLLAVALPMSLSGLLFPLMLMADSVFVPSRLRLMGMSLEQATARFGQLSGEAMPLVNLTMVVGAAVSVSLIPAIARAISQGNRAEAHRQVENAVHLVWLAGMPMAGGLVLLAHPLTALLYGQPGAAGALVVLALGSPVLSLQQILGASLQASGYGWRTVRNLLIGAVVKFVLTWALTPLPFWGIRGAALGTVAAAATTAILNGRDWIHMIGIPFQPLRTVLWPLTGTVVMAIGLNLWMTNPLALSRWLHVALAILLGACLYGAVMVISGETKVISAVLKEH